VDLLSLKVDENMGVVKILLWFGLSILSAICYRFGGSAKKGNWLDFARNSKTRDIGCSLLSLGLFIGQKGANLGFWWLYVIAFGLSWGFLSTYWDKLFGYDNYWFSGFMIGLVFIPLFWIGIPWWSIGIRAIVLAITMGLWSKWIDWDIAEESGRGFLITATIPLLLIC